VNFEDVIVGAGAAGSAPERIHITAVLLAYILVLAGTASVLGDAANAPNFGAVATVCGAIEGALSASVLVETVAGWL
jgi:hypothetical protein